MTLQYPEQHVNEVPTAVAKARALADTFRVNNPDLRIHLTGLSMLNNAFAETGQQDASNLMPIMFAVLLCMIFIVLRSISMIIGSLTVIIFSILATIGFAGFVGINLTPISIMAPIIVMTLAIADSVHILITVLALMRQGKPKKEAIIASIAMNFQAVSITSLTTMIGFLALNFSDAPPFWHLGNMTAFGIIAAWAASLFSLPAIMQILPLHVKPTQQDDNTYAFIRFIAHTVTEHHKTILLMTLIISLGFSAFIAKNTIDDNFVSYFDERVTFRTDTDFTLDHLTGIQQIEYSILSQGEGGVNQKAYLEGLSDFTHWLRQQPQVSHVYSYSDIIKRLNKNMHNDELDAYRLPKDSTLAAQYLLLYEFSLPYDLGLNDRISIDKSASRLTVTLGDLLTDEIRHFLGRAEVWMEKYLPSYMHAQPTGAAVIFYYIFKRNTESMLMGNITAIIMITLLLMVSLKSWRYGLISIIPNTLPILITFGLWGLLVGKVSLASASVSATALGIIVDDTVHFLTKYLHARRHLVYDQHGSIHYTFTMVGNWQTLTEEALSIQFDHVKNNDMAENTNFHQTQFEKHFTDFKRHFRDTDHFFSLYTATR